MSFQYTNKSTAICLTSSAGFLGLAKACAVGCSVFVVPLSALLTGLGFGSAAAYLPSLRLIFTGLAIFFAAFSVWSFAKRRSQAGQNICPCSCQRYLRKVFKLEG